HAHGRLGDREVSPLLESAGSPEAAPDLLESVRNGPLLRFNGAYRVAQRRTRPVVIEVISGARLARVVKARPVASDEMLRVGGRTEPHELACSPEDLLDPVDDLLADARIHLALLEEVAEVLELHEPGVRVGLKCRVIQELRYVVGQRNRCFGVKPR